jgi:hypothetical protein
MLATTIVVVATLATLVGFVQKASADPNSIYGIWKPPQAVQVFGLIRTEATMPATW